MKKFTRSSKNRVIAGVCGGIGEYFGIDPTLVRVIFAALLLMGGGGFLLYVLIWLIVPSGK